MKKKPATPKRKNTRFPPDPNTLARLTLKYGKKGQEECLALVLTESHGGCSVVLANAPRLVLGDRLQVQVGNLAPLMAEVRWVTALDEEVYKVGFMYTEEVDAK